MEPFEVVEVDREGLLSWAAPMCQAAEDAAWPGVGMRSRRVEEEFRRALDDGEVLAVAAVRGAGPVAVWVLVRSRPGARVLHCLGGAVEESLDEREYECAIDSVLLETIRAGRGMGMSWVSGMLAASRGRVRKAFERAGLRVEPAGRERRTGKVRSYMVSMGLDAETEGRVGAVLEANTA